MGEEEHVVEEEDVRKRKSESRYSTMSVPVSFFDIILHCEKNALFLCLM